jgi:hypothetical protein
VRRIGCRLRTMSTEEDDDDNDDKPSWSSWGSNGTDMVQVNPSRSNPADLEMKKATEERI